MIYETKIDINIKFLSDYIRLIQKMNFKIKFVNEEAYKLVNKSEKNLKDP